MSIMKPFAMSICMSVCAESKCQLRIAGKSFFLSSYNRVGKYYFKDSKSRRTSNLLDRFKIYNNFDAVFFNLKLETWTCGVFIQRQWTRILCCTFGFYFG